MLLVGVVGAMSHALREGMEGVEARHHPSSYLPTVTHLNVRTGEEETAGVHHQCPHLPQQPPEQAQQP